MEKIWLKSYAPGVPADINPDAYQSIIEIFNQSCQQFSDKPAFHSLGRTITYSETDKYSRDFAAYLQQRLQLKKGERLAIMLPNTLQYPIAMFGAMKAGLVVVNVNPLYTADELVHQLNDAEVTTLLVLENFASTVERALPRLPNLKNIIITRVGDMLPWLKATAMHIVLKYIMKKIPAWNINQALSFKDVLSEGQNLSLQAVPLTNQDIAFLQYTGGTTGVSKGAVLTHRNIVANVQQASAWFKSLLVDGQEVIITALPLYHIFSLLANCLFFTKIGGLNVLIINPRDLAGMVKEISKFKFTAITGVNTLFNALVKDKKFAALDFSHLKLALGGGMSVQKAVADKWQALTGAPLLEAYGLTETSPCVTINPANLKSYNGTIGLPVSSTEVTFFEIDDSTKEVAIGTPGELAIKGPQVMRGYWNNAAETAKVFTKDGWLLTGDIASIDELGFVRILERKKDMILVSGFNVYPNEIEAVLASMPEIKEAAVIGIPDEHGGEAVKAYVVKEDINVTPEAIIKFCRQHLTGYKIPKQIEFCTELPKSNVGKILRRELRESNHS